MTITERPDDAWLRPPSGPDMLGSFVVASTIVIEDAGHGGGDAFGAAIVKAVAHLALQ